MNNVILLNGYLLVTGKLDSAFVVQIGTGIVWLIDKITVFFKWLTSLSLSKYYCFVFWICKVLASGDEVVDLTLYRLKKTFILCAKKIQNSLRENSEKI